jgi:hypothetical protein
MKMRRGHEKLPLFIFLAVAVAFFIHAQEVSSRQDKKLIEWGFDMPTPEYLRDNIRKMEKQPFDGLVFRLRKQPAYSAFETKPLTEDEMKLEVLETIHSGTKITRAVL